MFRLHAFALLAIAAMLTACGGSPTTNSSSSTQNSERSSRVPTSAKTVYDIHKMANWSSCSGDCSGEPGTGATYSMTQSIGSPSLTGAAIKFDITGGTPWNTALWWKQLGGDDTKTHFLYELSFYVADPNAAQALEFNVNQNASGWRYEYATQCDFRGNGTWRIWDHTQMHWVSTGKPCPIPAANQWNKLALEFERTTDHRVHFIAVTLNGQRYPIDMYSDAFTASGSGIDVAFQMDSTGTVVPWSTWVDDIKLSEW